MEKLKIKNLGRIFPKAKEKMIFSKNGKTAKWFVNGKLMQEYVVGEVKNRKNN